LSSSEVQSHGEQHESDNFLKQPELPAMDAIQMALKLHIDNGFARLYKIPTKGVKKNREIGRKSLSRLYLEGEMTEESGLFWRWGKRACCDENEIVRRRHCNSIEKIRIRFKILYQA